METTLLQQNAFSFTMADDDMEISLEQGHDEDVDIDFDFEADQPDEDHILEDVGHETMENEAPQTFTYDEEMVDDDSHSYNMDDIDLVHDNGFTNGDMEAMSFGGDTSAQAEDSAQAENYVHITGTEVEDLDCEQILDLDHLEHTDQERLLENNNIPENEVNHQVQLQNEVLEVEGLGEVGQESHNSPAFQQQGDLAVAVVGAESPDSVHSPEARTTGETTTDLVEPDAEVIEQNDNQGVSTDANSATDHETSVRSVLPVTIPNVRVSWDGSDFPLFATSAADDPNSYFLSDLTIMDQPLSKFFEAFRNVIEAELSEEDELVFSIEDLGLEASEADDAASKLATSELTDPTLATSQIQGLSLSLLFQLYQRLLQNDEDGDREHEEGNANQLHIAISVKKSFSARLSKLMRGAAEGKGLSEFREEQNHDLLEFEEDTEQGFDHGSSIENSLPTNANEEDENGQYEEVEDKDEEAEQGSVDQEIESLPHSVLNADVLGFGSAADEEYGKNEDVSVQPKVGTSIPKALFDGEDDLLDYSEDELGFGNESVSLLRPETEDATSTKDDEHLNQSMVQATTSQQSTEEEEEEEEASAELQANNTKAVFDATEDVVPDDFEDENFEEEAARIDDEAVDRSDHNRENAALKFGHEEHRNNDTNHEAELNGVGMVPDENDGFELNSDEPEFTDHIEQEIDLATEQEANDKGLSEDLATVSTDLDVTNGTDQIQSSNEGENFDLATHLESGSAANLETAESSVTLGADEISYDDEDEEPLDGSGHFAMEQTNGVADLKFSEYEETEIGYEDDEEEEAGKVEVVRSGNSPPEVTELSPHGKRSIAEVDSDGVLDMRTNSIKRPRA